MPQLTQEQLLAALNQNPFVLAPMAGITDHSFRTFMKKMGAGVVVTELVSATGTNYASERTLSLMSYDESQRPIGIQLFGEDPEDVARAAQVAETKGADFIDLNFGCPVPKVVKKGAGSAMLKDLPNLTKMLNTVKAAVKIPVTIKIRTGWDSTMLTAHEVVHIAHNEGIAWVAIHGRTRAQGYSGLADWEYISEVKSKSKIPIIGNGDILAAKQAIEKLKASGCDGVMIGRGCLKNPYIFMDSLSLYTGKEIDHSDRSYSSVFNDLKDCLIERCDDRIVQIQLKKFAAWFSTGYPGAAQLRRDIFQLKNSQEVIQMANAFFESIGQVQQEDTSKEAFLMGGHG